MVATPSVWLLGHFREPIDGMGAAGAESRPRGRRPGRSSSRGEVLAAARAAFAEEGFRGATIRSIAQRAGVDPALVVRFFTTKQELFEAAMVLPFDPKEVVRAILDGPREEIGARMVEMFVRVWEDPEAGPRMLLLLRSAATHDAAAARLRELIDTGILTPVARALRTRDAPLRAQLVGSQLVGLGLARYILRLEPLASSSAEEICEMIAPTVQRYLTGEL